MIMDTLGAHALATEPPTDELMKRTPVGRKGNFISNVMWRNVFGQSLYQIIVVWFLQTKGDDTFGLDGPDSGLIRNTLIFNSFVFCQVLEGILDSYVFVSVITVTVLFQIIIVEFLVVKMIPVKE
ncbi:Calcium-transporting ATPase 2, plasma membrane-type [Heracleum sosnowskyi]|uniref:Calcium-transporting ATPase 2, plasma membrane-type n=1 Tax=Heracleum sosnowskyi TaxID=360622 RepID=A0AAD8IBN2_9APIA|nr:Calcium-transporting ATPase 2, plasma membrane-type [Heracleum sosnowskyi]